VLSSHSIVSSSRTVRPCSPLGGRWIGHWRTAWSTICPSSPHSQLVWTATTNKYCTNGASCRGGVARGESYRPFDLLRFQLLRTRSGETLRSAVSRERSLLVKSVIEHRKGAAESMLRFLPGLEKRRRAEWSWSTEHTRLTVASSKSRCKTRTCDLRNRRGFQARTWRWFLWIFYTALYLIDIIKIADVHASRTRY